MREAPTVQPLRVAVVGAECTGKSTLCEALAATLGAIWVPEHLRAWCDREGRTPARHEQAEILAEQIRLEERALADAAERGVRWVLCDSAPVVTALYSAHFFGDESLLEPASRHHATYALTVLTSARDMPWEADGIQRDGPHVRALFDEMLRTWLSGTPLRRLEARGSLDARVSAVAGAIALL